MKTSLLCATLLTGFAGLGPAYAASAPLVHAEAGRPVQFDVFLPLRNADRLEAFVAAQQDPASPSYHQWLTPKTFGLRFGPDSATISRVADALRRSGFSVTVQTRSLHVTGTADQVERNFGTRLVVARAPEGREHVQQEGIMLMPSELASAGAEILSFSPHVAHVHSRMVGQVNPANRYGPAGTLWFDDLKQAYQYPSYKATVTAADGTTKRLDGSGATIAALMSSDVYDADIQAMFDHENWSKYAHASDPTLAGRVYVNGGSGPIDVNSGAFDEASLDTQQEIGGAPGANVILYNIPDLSDGNVLAGYTTIDEQNVVDLVSSSFGECEQFYLPKYNGGISQRDILKAEHELFLQGNSQGITFLASSGDNAGKECPGLAYLYGGTAPYEVGVSTPAADPAVTAVGGTNLITSFLQNTLDSSYVGENGWSDPLIPYDDYGTGGLATHGVWGAGGGYSVIFKQPVYQTLLNTGSTTQRAVPDIGMQVGGCPGGISKLQYVPALHEKFCDGENNPADGSGNYQRSAVVVAIATQQGGGFYGFIGTSVSSPELASAAALLIEQNGRMGNLNTYIYNLAANQAAGQGRVYHTNIPGYNGVVNTDLNKTYSLTVGVGTPIVKAFVGQPDVSEAGLPQTPSNP